MARMEGPIETKNVETHWTRIAKRFLSGGHKVPEVDDENGFKTSLTAPLL